MSESACSHIYIYDFNIYMYIYAYISVLKGMCVTFLFLCTEGMSSVSNLTPYYCPNSFYSG